VLVLTTYTKVPSGGIQFIKG